MDLDEIDSSAGQLADIAGVESMDEHVESAVGKLEDENAVAFAIVAIRETDDDEYQTASHRAIDPEVISQSERNPVSFIDLMHDALCQVFDSEIREWRDDSE